MNLLAELEEFVGDYRPRRSSVRSTRLRLPCGALTAAHSCPPGRSSASNARRRLTRLAPRFASPERSRPGMPSWIYCGRASLTDTPWNTRYGRDATVTCPIEREAGNEPEPDALQYWRPRPGGEVRNAPIAPHDPGGGDFRGDGPLGRGRGLAPVVPTRQQIGGRRSCQRSGPRRS